MMKAFGSCPPEYRIMAVWIFIFLTLLYMILLICEGTGERKKKAMLQDSLLLIAAFLITSGLCVRQGFYGEEDFMVFLKMPYGILIIMGICGFLFAGIQAFGIYKRRTNCLRENAIQESLDNLPSGIGFFDRNGMPDDENKKFWGDYHYALAMKKELEKHGYQVDVRPYQRWYESTDSAVTIALRGNRPYYPKEEIVQKNIMWNISHPADIPQGEYERFDLVYFASEKLCRKWKNELKTKCDVLLQCADPDVMKSTAGEKKYDLLFIGNSRRVYRQIVQDALTLDYPLTIYGRHWEAFEEAQKCVREPYMPNDQVGQAYRDAKIVLNDHWDDMKETGIVSNRLFDALAAEAFIISDEMPEIAEIFEGTVVTYKDCKDLKEKVDYYMEHPKEAEKLAGRGHQLVLEKHTFAKRMDKLVQDLSGL